MQIEKLTILGFSEATIVMLSDILEYNNFFPILEIVNNLQTKPKIEFYNKKFKIFETDKIDDFKGLYLLGAAKTKTKFQIREFFNKVETNRFLNLISKNSFVSSTTEFGNGNVINPMCSISAFCKIHNFVYVNRGCTIGHHVEIKNYSTINPGVNIGGNTKIGEKTQIGIGSNIVDGVNIGSNVIIGAGSVVTKDIPDNVVAWGSPCKIIKENI